MARWLRIEHCRLLHKLNIELLVVVSQRVPQYCNRNLCSCFFTWSSLLHIHAAATRLTDEAFWPALSTLNTFDMALRVAAQIQHNSTLHNFLQLFFFLLSLSKKSDLQFLRLFTHIQKPATCWSVLELYLVHRAHSREYRTMMMMLRSQELLGLVAYIFIFNALTRSAYIVEDSTLFPLSYFTPRLYIHWSFSLCHFRFSRFCAQVVCGSARVSFGLSTVWCVALVGVFRFFLRFQSFWKFPIQYFVFAHRSQFLWSCRCRKMLSRIVAEFTWVLLSFFLLSVYDFGPFSVSTRARVRKSELNN